MRITKEDVGRTVRLRNGGVYAIEFYADDNDRFPIQTSSGVLYNSEGRSSIIDTSEWDIVAWYGIISPNKDLIETKTVVHIDNTISEAPETLKYAFEGSTLSLAIPSGTKLLEGVFEADNGEQYEVTVNLTER